MAVISQEPRHSMNEIPLIEIVPFLMAGFRVEYIECIGLDDS
jgi:hypothetical protein